MRNDWPGMVVLPLLAAVIVSAAAIIGSTLILFLGARAERAAIWILSFAIGTLIAGSALHLLPEALESQPAERVMLLFVISIVAFIGVERAIRWRHSHLDGGGHQHERATAEVLLWGDALHNFVDGVIIGVTFSTSIELGTVATIAIFAHEVPQEIGDFAILLSSGMERRRALLLNYLSSAAVIPGAFAAWLWSEVFRSAIGWLLPVAAGGFLYIALADLVPTLHHSRGRRAAVVQVTLITLGVLTVYLTGRAFTTE